MNFAKADEIMRAAVESRAFPAAVLREAVAARFAHKKPGLLEMNMRAFDAGRERAAALVGQACVPA